MAEIPDGIVRLVEAGDGRRAVTRVTGHGLVAEGAPHDDAGRRISGIRAATSGPGRGRCQCGALSDTLESTAARRSWHREHKMGVCGGCRV